MEIVSRKEEKHIVTFTSQDIQTILINAALELAGYKEDYTVTEDITVKILPIKNLKGKDVIPPVQITLINPKRGNNTIPPLVKEDKNPK